MDALTTINTVAAIPEEEWSLTTYTSFYEPLSASNHRPSLSFYNWLGFIALINRPWFRRAWVCIIYASDKKPANLLTPVVQVVQEIALAKSAIVICGTKSFEWDNLSKTLRFVRATKWYHHLNTDKMRHVASLNKNPGIYKNILQSGLDVGIGPLYLDATRLRLVASAGLNLSNRKTRPSLQLLLDTHRFSKSTDPRDKIYAFLGLANRNMAPFRAQSNALTPDYNLSVQEVYTDAARVLLTSSGKLSLLAHVQDASQTRIPNLPSWVPDFSVGSVTLGTSCSKF